MLLKDHFNNCQRAIQKILRWKKIQEPYTFDEKFCFKSNVRVYTYTALIEGSKGNFLHISLGGQSEPVEDSVHQVVGVFFIFNLHHSTTPYCRQLSR